LLSGADGWNAVLCLCFSPVIRCLIPHLHPERVTIYLVGQTKKARLLMDQPMSAKKLPEETAAMIREFQVLNKLGIHARPAAMFVKTANRFACDIFVEKDGEKVNGKSIMGLMMLAAGPGSKLTITAEGPDASKALSEIEGLIKRKFDEE
jgi:phosphocarrier protein HPr